MKIEHNKHTVNGVTTSSKLTVNGKEVHGLRKWLVIGAGIVSAAVAFAIVGPFLFLIMAVLMVWIGALFVVVGAMAPFAYIYRLVTGKWPSWFQVEVRREGGRK